MTATSISTEVRQADYNQNDNYGTSYYGYNFDEEDTKPGIGSKSTIGFKCDAGIAEPITLFVYGILRKNFSLNAVVARDKFLRSCKTKNDFSMINIGNSFPAILFGGRTSIVGELYEILPRTVNYLDSIEKHPNVFRRQTISLDDGSIVYAYVLNSWKAPTYREVIDSGDWVQWKKSQRNRRNQQKQNKFEKRIVQVSNVSTSCLRKLLEKSGIKTLLLLDSEVRIAFIKKYGHCLTINEND